ncbi:tyrosine-type recombinase/integrase [Arthrobacter sp. SA17]
MSYLSSGSRFRVETVPPSSELDVLRAALRPDFLAAAGWKADDQILAPPRNHPLLGVRQCPRKDCSTSVATPGHDLCQACGREFRSSSLSIEAFLDTTSGRPVRGERFCLVTDCPRPTNQRTGLCLAHNFRFKQHPSSTVEDWLQATRPTPFSSFGPCLVASCSRVAAVPNRLCHPHALRWSRSRRTDPPPVLAYWARSQEPPADSGRIVEFKGLPDQVITEILAGLQWRTDDHTKTSMSALRALVRHARQQQVSSIFDLLDPGAGSTSAQVTALIRAMTLAVRRSLTSPEREQQRDRWDLAIFGGKGQINFKVLSQPWLREAAKHWVLEDLPLHRGRQATATSKQTVLAIRYLSWSLQHGRQDHGLVLSEVDRTDIVRFTNRLAYLERTGQISSKKRYVISTRVRRFLDDVRSFGLTRPGQPLAGLPDDFRRRHSDVPRPPENPGPGRDLPIPVQRTINAHLAELEARAGLDVRRIVEVLIDTGRRPEEACQLPWDCLDSTPDGQVLIYTNSKNNRPNRRLPISVETADLIREHRENVRQRFPNTPLDQLALFPRNQLNPYGTFHVGVPHMSKAHRAFIDSIAEQLVDDADQPFPAAVVVLYAYRHSYAQRDADNGTPPDVLRDLMGHVSMETTMGYYRVTEKRVRHAVNQVAQHQFDSQGRRVFADIAGLVAEEHARLRVGQIAVPFGVCTEPSNVKAGGHACPYKYSCIGCGHFRSDASYLPELKSYLQQLLADRERILAATDVQEWVRAKTAPSDEEIAQLRALIRRVENDLDQLSPADQQRIQEAVDVIRSARQKVSLGMPTIGFQEAHP